jgi:RNA polymerase sigma factor (sigma-70 family)
MKELSDEDLLNEARHGSREAFNELVRRNQERVYWTIRRFVGDADDAKDLAQDVFVKAYHGMADFRGDSQVFTWLYRIALNLSINHIRKRKLRSFVDLDTIIDSHGSDEFAPDRAVEASEVKTVIANAIETLPRKQKAVFVLRYYEQLSYEEIAGILNRSVGGLKANYFHAVRKIEEYVKNAM